MMTCVLFLRTSSFVNFFLSKVRDIWSSLESAGSDQEPELPLMSCTFSTFSLAVTAEVASLILHCHQKSSPLDPIPTYLLKNLVDVLVAPITKIIVNLSLPPGLFPYAKKLTLITPLLKKPKMDPEILNNHWPVSNLFFLSKLIERVVKQLYAHFESDSESLFLPVQSAY